MLTNYLKIAWRSLLKNRVTGFINIAGLAIGMAVALVIGLWLQDELTFDKYHQHYDDLASVMIHQTYNDKINTFEAVSLPSRQAIGEYLGDDLENLSLASWNFNHVLGYQEKSFIRAGLYVEPVFPEMLSLEMIHGDYENCLKDPMSIVLSESVAQALFGDKDPMGKIVVLDTDTEVKVTGVFKDLPFNTSFEESKILLPWKLYEIQQSWIVRAKSMWNEHSFQMFAQKTSQASFAAISAKIRDIEKPHDESSNPEYFLHPMSNWHLYNSFKDGVVRGGRIQYVWLFGIIGAFVLILACINFMNLSTARSERRAKEVGIRKTIGSMRGQLIGQFLSESLLVAFIAMFFALALTYFPLSWFNDISGKSLSIPYTEPKFWLAIIGFTFITGFLAGSYPAFYLSSFKPLTVLKGTFQAGRWAKVPRQALVTAQFTISIALIIGTLVVYQQIEHAKNRPVGYDRNHTIQFLTNKELINKVEIFRNDLLQSNKVEEAAYANSPITSVWSNTSSVSWAGKDPELVSSFAQIYCSPEFGKTIGWEIVHGRDFSRDYSLDSMSLILNEAAVDQIGLDQVVGEDITVNGGIYKVIGVVKDILMQSPWAPVKATTFRLDPQRVNMHIIRLKEDVPVDDAIAAVHESFKKSSPSSPFEFEFVDEQFNAKFESEERIGKLAYIFAFLAIFISCLGLFGLSAFVAERRNKEIGVRKVLGATVANLWVMQSKDFIRLVLIACLLATPVAWYFLEEWLSKYDYRVYLDGSVFFIAALLALVVTLVTVSYQSIRAAMMNPVDSLKEE